MKIKSIAVLGALLAGSVVAIPATPAFAALSLYRVNAPSALNDDSSPKTATVSCNPFASTPSFAASSASVSARVR